MGNGILRGFRGLWEHSHHKRQTRRYQHVHRDFFGLQLTRQAFFFRLSMLMMSRPQYRGSVLLRFLMRYPAN